MPIDKFVLVDLLCGDQPLREHTDAVGREVIAHQCCDLVVHCMRFNEGESGVRLASTGDLEVGQPLFGRHAVVRLHRGAVLWVVREHEHPLQAMPRIQVFQDIEHGHPLAFKDNLGIGAPVLHGREWHTCREDRLAEKVVRDVHAHPVDAFRKRLEGARRGMNAVVAGVGAFVQTEGHPLLVEDFAQRARFGRLWVCGAQDLAPEILPGQALRVPLSLDVVNVLARSGELSTHVHVEAVDDKYTTDPAAVEATSELDQVRAADQLPPPGSELLRADPQLGRCIHGIEHEALLHSRLPGDAKGPLELSLGLWLHGQLHRLEAHGLVGDGPVVPVDELVLVNLLCGDAALGDGADAVGGHVVLYKLNHAVHDCMRLDERESRVRLASMGDLEVRQALLSAARALLQGPVGCDLVLRTQVLLIGSYGQGFVQALPHVQVLQEVEERLLLALVHDVRVGAPEADRGQGYACREQSLAKVVV
mmetsp:Transcript_65989/g.182732  ORF Transcript_65989/g.182732 Transcript_65989/m.182732 type:complete len:477 (-) Transcript_65989:905-2335(-)